LLFIYHNKLSAFTESTGKVVYTLSKRITSALWNYLKERKRDGRKLTAYLEELQDSRGSE